MKRAAFIAVLAGTMSAAAAEPVLVPSGMPVRFQEMIWDQPGGGLIYRFRFVAPQIGQQGHAFEDVMDDMAHLCQVYALPKLAGIGPVPTQIVISLAQKPTPFGEAAPEVTQFFEAYSIRDGACMWDIF